MARMMRDFTMSKYKELCTTLLYNGYTPLTVNSYLNGRKKGKLVILRHDIDRKTMNALKKIAESDELLLRKEIT